MPKPSSFICKAHIDGTFESLINMGMNVPARLLDDKNFGFMKPRNGELLYALTNSDTEITNKNAKKSLSLALFEWGLYVPIRFRKAKPSETADIVVTFRSEEEDEILDSSTLAYMYYPISAETMGICVVNTRFYWTANGKGIDMHELDPTHYPTAGTGAEGMTWDLDQVLRHELGHGVFGLPHSQSVKVIMAPSYSYMAEYITPEDISRAQAKAGIRTMLSSRLERLKAWYARRSE